MDVNFVGNAVVFGVTLDSAKRKLKDIANKLDEEILNCDNRYIQTKTKKYQAECGGEHSGGHRYKYAYVESELKDTECMVSILHKIVPYSKDGYRIDHNPYEQIEYF